MLETSRAISMQWEISDENRLRALQIVRTYGKTPLAWFALFDDKSYFFSGGGSVIAYILEGKMAITLGDCIGPIEDFVQCLNEFKMFCMSNGWLCVFFQVLPDHLNDYVTAGFDALCIGHDAIVDLPIFNLEGRGSKNFRNSFHKMTRLGYTVQLCEPPHATSLVDEISMISKKWLVNRGGHEIGFSIGRLDQEYLNACPLFLVRDPNGVPEAFANIILDHQTNEATIDLMRYDPGSKNGLMDFLFTFLLLWSKECGITSFNLGFSPLSGIGEQPHSPMIERALRFLLDHSVRFQIFRGLQFFKGKFNPTWSPRYLVYPGIKSLLNVVIGIARAYKVDRLFFRSFFRCVKLVER